MFPSLCHSRCFGPWNACKRESFGRSDAAPKEIAVDATQAGCVLKPWEVCEFLKMARQNPESQ